jgi:hypothetical protein
MMIAAEAGDTAATARAEAAARVSILMAISFRRNWDG